jgi:hypothetical protein
VQRRQEPERLALVLLRQVQQQPGKEALPKLLQLALTRLEQVQPAQLRPVEAQQALSEERLPEELRLELERLEPALPKQLELVQAQVELRRPERARQAQL